MPSEPLVLAFDTSAAHCAAALLSGDALIDTRHEDMVKGQAERLVPLLQDVLSDAGLDFCDLSAIGVGVGPGNFTGIRIAVSAARGLGLGLGIPVIGVDGFDTRHFQHPGSVTVLIHAPRDFVYRRDYTDKGTQDVGLQPHAQAVEEATRLGHQIISDLDPRTQVSNMARLTAQRRETSVSPPAPLYMRPADAAPSRIAPPTIL